MAWHRGTALAGVLPGCLCHWLTPLLLPSHPTASPLLQVPESCSPYCIVQFVFDVRAGSGVAALGFARDTNDAAEGACLRFARGGRGGTIILSVAGARLAPLRRCENFVMLLLLLLPLQVST